MNKTEKNRIIYRKMIDEVTHKKNADLQLLMAKQANLIKQLRQEIAELKTANYALMQNKTG